MVGVLGLVVFQQSVAPTQDTRSQAINPSGQVTVRWVANSSSLAPGQQIVFTGYINTRQLQTDGVQLVMLLPKVSVTNPSTLLLPNSGLQVGLNQVNDQGDRYELRLIALPATIGQPFSTTTEIPFATIRATANQTGSFQLSADQTRCFVTRFGSNPVIDELAPVSAVGFTVSGGGSQPTATPTPISATATPTPITPTATPTPTPSISGNVNTLSLAFRLQGLTRPNQELEGIVYLQNNSSILDGEQSDSLSIEYELPAKFKSGQNGIITPIENIRLSDIPIAPGGTRYDIFVKTPVSLRKKLGTLVLKPGTNAAPTEWAQIQLKTGDFWQSPRAEWNVLNLRDLSQILNVYTQLQIATTATNKQFDVNFDGFIDIMDVAIVLSNYTQLEVRGD